MKCAACGYSDVKADDYREDPKVTPWNMPPNGSVDFIDLGWYSVWKMYACPICGTVKIEV